MHTIRNGIAGATLALAATLAAATTTTLAGNLGDSGNAALVGSDLGAPDFSDDNAIADNVALYAFTVTVPGTVDIVSTGFAAGGVDPYFTLFAGGDDGATVYDSNYYHAFSTGGDFAWSGTLVAGSYQIALGSFANMSIAENYGVGTLADGFTFLGDPGSLGDGSYSLGLTTPVPEPSQAWLLGVGLAALATRALRARRPG
jgi:hypothetical protein